MCRANAERMCGGDGGRAAQACCTAVAAICFQLKVPVVMTRGHWENDVIPGQGHLRRSVWISMLCVCACGCDPLFNIQLLLSTSAMILLLV